MELALNNVPSFKLFLENFCRKHADFVDEEATFPFRITQEYVSYVEVEGKVIDWTLLYLEQQKCPCILAAKLARAVSDYIITSDLSVYETQMVLVDSEPQLEVDKVAQTTFHQLYTICQLWHDELPVIHIPDTLYESSVHAIKNVRRRMEDRHVVAPDINTLYNLQHYSSQSYFAVFDGHGGTEASVYSASQLLSHLVRHSLFYDDVQSALRDAYLITDREFSKKAEREQLLSGSTGVSILIRDKKLHIAWLGDSQAVLVRSGTPVIIMNPHKPERADEKQRIEALGGCVIWYGAWRVNGTLSVSRAIGDFKHKPFISGHPDVDSYSLDGTEDYVVLACDGLWDFVSYAEVVQCVYEHIQTGGSRSTAAQRLVQLAREKDSVDNISVVVVFFRDNISEPLEAGKNGDILNSKNEDVCDDLYDIAPETEENGSTNSQDKTYSKGSTSLPPSSDTKLLYSLANKNYNSCEKQVCKKLSKISLVEEVYGEKNCQSSGSIAQKFDESWSKNIQPAKVNVGLEKSSSTVAFLTRHKTLTTTFPPKRSSRISLSH